MKKKKYFKIVTKWARKNRGKKERKIDYCLIPSASSLKPLLTTNLAIIFGSDPRFSNSSIPQGQLRKLAFQQIANGARVPARLGLLFLRLMLKRWSYFADGRRTITQRSFLSVRSRNHFLSCHMLAGHFTTVCTMPKIFFNADCSCCWWWLCGGFLRVPFPPHTWIMYSPFLCTNII